ncbi:MAG: PH domain-containing protein [Oscillospiraceae bacterium]|nr:PH domain-containing protein [Oscillospiraceae bacterium]
MPDEKNQESDRAPEVNLKESQWRGRKRTFLGLPWSFTRYRLTREKLIVDTGFWSRHKEEVRLFRVKDMCLNRKLVERILGLGTITVYSGDASSPTLELKRIKDSEWVLETLSDLVDAARRRELVLTRETMGRLDISERDIDGDGIPG